MSEFAASGFPATWGNETGVIANIDQPGSWAWGHHTGLDLTGTSPVSLATGQYVTLINKTAQMSQGQALLAHFVNNSALGVGGTGIGLNSWVQDPGMAISQGTGLQITGVEGDIARAILIYDDINGRVSSIVIDSRADSSSIIDGWIGIQTRENLPIFGAGGFPTHPLVVATDPASTHPVDPLRLVGVATDNTLTNLLVADAAGVVHYRTVGSLPSDKRLKMNIQPIDGALNKVNAIGGYTYQFNKEAKPDAGFNDRMHMGVIAQEVEKVAPELVETSDQGFKSVNYAEMNALLIEAIKELNDKVETLEAENAQLKAQNSELAQLKEEVANIRTLLSKVQATPTEMTGVQDIGKK